MGRTLAHPEQWWVTLQVLAACIGAGVLAWLVGRLVRRFAARSTSDSAALVHRLLNRPWMFAAMSLAAMSVLEARPQPNPGWHRAAVIAVIAATCWLIVAGLEVLDRLMAVRLPIDAQDNRRARRVRTQLMLIRRIGSAVVVLIGLAASLLTFPTLRTFGASLLASAGIAGVLAGLASQTLLRSVIAGLQLAFTDALRMDDVVVAEGEWGWVEDVTLTYVVLRLWDERRLVLPTTYFVTTPFQNWTRTYSRVLGSVVLHLDHRTPVDLLRDRARQVIEASPLWDRRDWAVQVIGTTETTIEVRVLASAYDAPTSWDLQCDVREALLAWLRDEHPEALPVRRVQLPDAPSPAGAAPRSDAPPSDVPLPDAPPRARAATSPRRDPGSVPPSVLPHLPGGPDGRDQH